MKVLSRLGSSILRAVVFLLPVGVVLVTLKIVYSIGVLGGTAYLVGPKWLATLLLIVILIVLGEVLAFTGIDARVRNYIRSFFRRKFMFGDEVGSSGEVFYHNTPYSKLPLYVTARTKDKRGRSWLKLWWLSSPLPATGFSYIWVRESEVVFEDELETRIEKGDARFPAFVWSNRSGPEHLYDTMTYGRGGA